MTARAPRHSPRNLLLHWMSGALAAVEPSRCVATALPDHPGDRIAVLALGKAATGMALGAHAALGERVERALVIAPRIPLEPLPNGWQVLAGDHPLPGSNSLAAGAAIESWLHALEPEQPLLVLLSGGGSALAELPVAKMALPDLQAVNRWLLASGLDIHDINRVRARFSRLKQGGLLCLAGNREVSGLVMSDVPGDDIADVASGPLSPKDVEWPDTGLPDWLRGLHATLPMPPGDFPETKTNLRIIARNADALDAIEKRVEAENISMVFRGGLSGDAETAGTGIAKRMLQGPQGVYLLGGETSVRLPGSPGKGGRNQQLALGAARVIAGRDDLFLLAFGTDGIDGNTEDAGALVDGGTLERVRDAGMNAADSLARADSNPALAAAGDVIHTGPTGTNVADLVIGLKTAGT